jgi:hypothetical protein
MRAWQRGDQPGARQSLRGSNEVVMVTRQAVHWAGWRLCFLVRPDGAERPEGARIALVTAERSTA